jgi:hypothetical protein
VFAKAESFKSAALPPREIFWRNCKIVLFKQGMNGNPTSFNPPPVTGYTFVRVIATSVLADDNTALRTMEYKYSA